MREFCLMSRYGDIVNMSVVHKDKAPVENEYQKSMGLKWVPIEQVPTAALHRYRFWNERP